MFAICLAIVVAVKVILDSKDSDWLARLYPSPYTAAHRFGIVIMAFDCVFMRVDVNENFFENDVCTMLSLKTEGGKMYDDSPQETSRNHSDGPAGKTTVRLSSVYTGGYVSKLQGVLLPLFQ